MPSHGDRPSRSRQTCQPAASRAAFPCSGKVTRQPQDAPPARRAASSKRRTSSAQRSSMSDGGRRRASRRRRARPRPAGTRSAVRAPAARAPSIVVGNQPARSASSSVSAARPSPADGPSRRAKAQDRDVPGALERAELVVSFTPTAPRRRRPMISRWRSRALGGPPTAGGRAPASRRPRAAARACTR